MNSAGYKNNIQKPVTFLDINNEILKGNAKKIIYIYILHPPK